MMLPALLAAALPVVACPTVDGIPGATPAKLPQTVEIAVEGADLAAYASTAGAPPYLIAPRGLTCKAALGADATLTIEVPGMKFTQIPGCRVCQLSLACAGDKAAAKALHAEFPEAKCRPRAKSTRAFWDGGFYAQVTCTLAKGCAKLSEATLRYRGSSRRARASR